MEPYKKYYIKKNDLSNSIKVSRSIIALPSSVNLGDREIKNICSNLNALTEKLMRGIYK